MLGAIGAIGAIFLAGILPAHAEWQWVRRLETASLEGKKGTLFFVDADNGWVAGSDSRIRHTENGGKDWVAQSIPTSNIINAIRFSDADKGLAIGNGGTVLRTQDGGKNWSLRPVPTKKHLRGMHFKNADTGWVVGDSATILRTTDGGSTWTDVVTERTAPIFIQTPGDLRSIDFADDRTGWAVGYSNIVFKTHDGGATWRAEYLADIPVAMLSVRFFSPGNGMIVGSDGDYRTSDSGRTWKHITTDQRFSALSEVFLLDSNHAWMVQEELYFQTEDGFLTATAFSENSLHGFQFLDAKKGWALGKGGVFATDDGGKSWSIKFGQPRSNLPTYLKSLNSVHFTDSLHGWALAINGPVIQTEDGGNTWKWRQDHMFPNAYLVYFSDTQRGWIAGNGWNFRTRNSGAEWDSLEGAFQGITPKSMYFENPRLGWLTGGYGSGYVLRTDDSGKSWVSQKTGVGKDLQAIQFADERIGWAVGDSGTLIRTSDGGKTWTASHIATTQSLRDLHFIDAKRGWVVGGAAEIYRTLDGGASWQSHEVSAGKWQTVRFADALTGWAGGENGMMQTLDGGQTWEPVPNMTGSSISDIHLRKDGGGWAVGANPMAWSLEFRSTTRISHPKAGRDSFRPKRKGFGESVNVFPTHRGGNHRVRTDGRRIPISPKP